MTAALRAGVGTLAVLVLGAGCTSSGSPSAPVSTPTSAVSATPAPSSSDVTCPPAGAPQAWPKQAPPGLPQPPGLRIVSVQRQPNVVVHFSVPNDFRATVRYLLEALPNAGFTLGTGDSEAEEADIPFSNASDRASIKVNDDGECVTAGLLAVGTD